MDTNTTSEQLHDLIESLYPDTVDADVASQFNIKLGISPTLQQRALACPANLVELEVCALCGDADPRRVCRELHFV